MSKWRKRFRRLREGKYGLRVLQVLDQDGHTIFVMRATGAEPPKRVRVRFQDASDLHKFRGAIE